MTNTKSNVIPNDKDYFMIIQSIDLIITQKELFPVVIYENERWMVGDKP